MKLAWGKSKQELFEGLQIFNERQQEEGEQLLIVDTEKSEMVFNNSKSELRMYFRGRKKWLSL